MSSPVPSASAEARIEELYRQDVNVIPPKAAKRTGVPKLQLPMPSSLSSSNAYSRPPPPKLSLQARSIPSHGHAPTLQLSIPNNNTFNNLHLEADEGYEGSAGTSSVAFKADASGWNGNVSHQSIYPNTVPYGGSGQAADPLALTNDLRRAIGGLSVDDKRSAVEEDVSSSGEVGPTSKYSRLYTPSSSSTTGAAKSGLEVGTDTLVLGPSPSQELEEESELQLKGNLEVLNRLGEGASGEVRSARYRPTGLIMAMKTISTSPNPAIHRQILRELAFNRSCHSDYIVRYYGAFLESEDTSIVICMEQCEAGSLDGIYKRCKSRNGRMGEKILAKIAESGLKGLGYLHERKIIHRDIKPSNILVTRQGQIKLCDFGVSGELINSMAGTFTGTSYYMAPERIRGLPYTITSDVWSLGLTILELASNRFPFPPEGEPALGPIDLLSYIVTMKVPELQDDAISGIKWTKAFKDFLENCLEKDGTKRYGPIKMLNHPFIKKSITRIPQPNVAKFVADVWGWDYPEEAEEEQTSLPSKHTRKQPSNEIPILVNADVPGLGRVASVRKAPSPLRQQGGGAGDAARIATLTSANMATGQDSNTPIPSHSLHVDGRTANERALAKKREADVGLVGSPVEEI
ncbi:hypothetical protein CBS101457_001565 [Exobasidium rhododendri]|nr:hypothetical protein CBS101457_001565 [Exobasidium rhododendri]